MVSCLSYYNSSLNLCWSVSIVQKQKPIMAEAQSCGRFARVTRPSDWSLDNQEVGRSQLNEGFFFCCVSWCVRALDRPTCEYMSTTLFCVEDRDFSQWFFFSPELQIWRDDGNVVTAAECRIFQSKVQQFAPTLRMTLAVSGRMDWLSQWCQKEAAFRSVLIMSCLVGDAEALFQCFDL